MVEECKLEDIGPWSEIKLEIIRKYAEAYSTILSRHPQLKHIYIDAFAGPGRHISRATGAIVDGSPKVVLDIEPHFAEYHFIDIAMSAAS